MKGRHGTGGCVPYFLYHALTGCSSTAWKHNGSIHISVFYVPQFPCLFFLGKKKDSDSQPHLSPRHTHFIPHRHTAPALHHIKEHKSDGQRRGNGHSCATTSEAVANHLPAVALLKSLFCKQRVATTGRDPHIKPLATLVL